MMQSMIKQPLNFGLNFGNDEAEPSAPHGTCGLTIWRKARLRVALCRVRVRKTLGAEPSLALTRPKQPTELDDGRLPASEVTHLKLNAD